MIELHGWITLRESYEADNEEDNLSEIVAGIENHINNMNLPSYELSLKYLNGIPNISISLYKNRVTQEVKDVFSLLELIADRAKGSYGLVYLHDDEDTNDKDNIFQVYVLARGAIKVTTDTFLSPLIPTVEDME